MAETTPSTAQPPEGRAHDLPLARRRLIAPAVGEADRSRVRSSARDSAWPAVVFVTGMSLRAAGQALSCHLWRMHALCPTPIICRGSMRASTCVRSMNLGRQPSHRSRYSRSPSQSGSRGRCASEGRRRLAGGTSKHSGTEPCPTSLDRPLHRSARQSRKRCRHGRQHKLYALDTGFSRAVCRDRR
jgi:hypothetical protein